MSWTGYDKGVGRRLVHSSGWIVRHCGHPTALYPWYLISPEGISYTGRSGAAWTHQADAKLAAEDLAAGGTGQAFPISIAQTLRAEQKASPYAGAARKRMKPEKRAEQKEILERTNAERWRWVGMTHAQALREFARRGDL